MTRKCGQLKLLLYTDNNNKQGIRHGEVSVPAHHKMLSGYSAKHLITSSLMALRSFTSNIQSYLNVKSD